VVSKQVPGLRGRKGLAPTHPQFLLSSLIPPNWSSRDEPIPSGSHRRPYLATSHDLFSSID
jgi:hypothetical protein